MRFQWRLLENDAKIRIFSCGQRTNETPLLYGSDLIA